MRVELYNLDTDLAETTDVAAQHPEIAAEMSQLMQGTTRQSITTPGNPGRQRRVGETTEPPPSHARRRLVGERVRKQLTGQTKVWGLWKSIVSEVNRMK